MTIYEYDVYGGDKGIIFANSEEQATELYKKGYGGLVYGVDTEEDDYDVCTIRTIGEIPDEPTLYVFY